MLLKFFQKRQNYRNIPVYVNKKGINAILADTSLKRMIGLMYREKLEQNTCMLFAFPDQAKHGIWMLNMRFPIDVIWLDDKKRIVHIEKNLVPCKSAFYCKTYSPKRNSSYVIELPSGFISKNRISNSTKIRF